MIVHQHHAQINPWSGGKLIYGIGAPGRKFWGQKGPKSTLFGPARKKRRSERKKPQKTPFYAAFLRANPGPSKITPTRAPIRPVRGRLEKNQKPGLKKKKQIEENTAESQSIVVQDNSNPYNTSPKLSRLQMI